MKSMLGFVVALATIAAVGCGSAASAKKSPGEAAVPEHATSCVTSLGPTDHPNQAPTDEAIARQLCQKLGSEGIWYVDVEKDAMSVMLDNSTFKALDAKLTQGTPLQKLEVQKWTERLGQAFQLESQQQDVRVLALGGDPLQRVCSVMSIGGEWHVVGCPDAAK